MCPYRPHRVLRRCGPYRAGGLQVELGQGLRGKLEVRGQRGLLVAGAEGRLADGGGGLRDRGQQGSEVSRGRQGSEVSLASHALATGDLPDSILFIYKKNTA